MRASPLRCMARGPRVPLIAAASAWVCVLAEGPGRAAPGLGDPVRRYSRRKRLSSPVPSRAGRGPPDSRGLGPPCPASVPAGCREWSRARRSSRFRRVSPLDAPIVVGSMGGRLVPGDRLPVRRPQYVLTVSGRSSIATGSTIVWSTGTGSHNPSPGSCEDHARRASDPACRSDSCRERVGVAPGGGRSTRRTRRRARRGALPHLAERAVPVAGDPVSPAVWAARCTCAVAA